MKNKYIKNKINKKHVYANHHIMYNIQIFLIFFLEERNFIDSESLGEDVPEIEGSFEPSWVFLFISNGPPQL